MAAAVAALAEARLRKLLLPGLFHPPLHHTRLHPLPLPLPGEPDCFCLSYRGCCVAVALFSVHWPRSTRFSDCFSQRPLLHCCCCCCIMSSPRNAAAADTLGKSIILFTALENKASSAEKNGHFGVQCSIDYDLSTLIIRLLPTAALSSPARGRSHCCIKKQCPNADIELLFADLVYCSSFLHAGRHREKWIKIERWPLNYLLV